MNIQLTAKEREVVAEACLNDPTRSWTGRTREQILEVIEEAQCLAAQRKFARKLKGKLIGGLTLGYYGEPERYTLLAKDLRELCQELGMEEEP